MELPNFVNVLKPAVYSYRYSICTLVTKEKEYLEMLSSFMAVGFTNDICEFIIVDNSIINSVDSYEAINRFLRQAKGKYVIICHQDILLTEHSTKAILDQRIAEMDLVDNNWAVLSNAGSISRLTKRNVIKIAYPDGFIDVKGKFPTAVCSVDENFMLVKNAANLSVSANLYGYHLYGLDLCMIANMIGYNCYVIDYLLIHKSKGNVDESFYNLSTAIQNKYTYFMRGRYINTTITSFYLSGSNFKNKLFETRLFKRLTKILERL